MPARCLLWLATVLTVILWGLWRLLDAPPGMVALCLSVAGGTVVGLLVVREVGQRCHRI